MKTTFSTLFKFAVLFTFIHITIDSTAQKTIGTDKIDAIINLSKFIDWHYDYNNPHIKKSIIIISDQKTSINFEIQSKNNFKYKNWQIICSNKYDQINDGSIVFITNEHKSKVSNLIRISKVKNILTIADNIDNFCVDGGMINIKKHEGKYRFEINYKKIQDQNIEISSKLLALAKIL